MTEKRSCKILLVCGMPERLFKYCPPDMTGMGELISLILSRFRDDSLSIAPSISQALTMAEQNPPDLVILTSEMLDTKEYGRLRATPALSRAPILFLDPSLEAVIHPRAKALGAKGVVRMPFGPQELLTARDAVLRGGTYYPPQVE